MNPITLMLWSIARYLKLNPAGSRETMELEQIRRMANHDR
jgi:hypothetical protein